jgi:hypothetical protein
MLKGGNVECDLYTEHCLPSDLLVLTTVTALYTETLEKLYQMTASDPLNVRVTHHIQATKA